MLGLECNNRWLCAVIPVVDVFLVFDGICDTIGAMNRVPITVAYCIRWVTPVAVAVEKLRTKKRFVAGIFCNIGTGCSGCNNCCCINTGNTATANVIVANTTNGTTTLWNTDGMVIYFFTWNDGQVGVGIKDLFRRWNSTIMCVLCVRVCFCKRLSRRQQRSIVMVQKNKKYR